MKDLQQTSFCVPISSINTHLWHIVLLMKSTGTTTFQNMQVLKQCYNVLYQLLTSLKEERLLEKSQMQITSQESH